MLNLFPRQPPAFRMIFMLEVWERFGYYTVQGVLTLYFIRYLGFDDTHSYYTFGAFSALVYGMVVIGGYLGDRVLGTKRTIVLGLWTLALGYGALAIANKDQVFHALGLICVGNGLFKANPSNLLAKCYDDNDNRLHSGFTLYYMAINLGSIAALLLGPIIASTYGYSYTYFLSSLGLIIGLATYYLQRRYIAHINTEADNHSLTFLHWIMLLGGLVLVTCCCAYLLQHILLAKNLLWLITAIVLVFYGYLMSKEAFVAQIRMIIAFILMFEAVIFFTLYQQMPTSLNLFAVQHVYPHLLGLTIDPQSFQALNPIWIVLMSPVLAYFYSYLNKKNSSFPISYKFALGMALCGLSFLMLYFTRYFYTGNGVVSPWWMVGSYLFQSLGELLVSALGVAMVAELVPAYMAGFVMGIWFLTSAIAGFIGASVATYTVLPSSIQPGIASLMLYTNVFAYIGLITLLMALVMGLFSPYLNRYLSLSATDSKYPSQKE